MLILWTSVLDVNFSWFFGKNFIKDRIYWEIIVSTPNDWNSGLQEILGLEPVTILTIFFWAKNILLLSKALKFPPRPTHLPWPVRTYLLAKLWRCSRPWHITSRNWCGISELGSIHSTCVYVIFKQNNFFLYSLILKRLSWLRLYCCSGMEQILVHHLKNLIKTST